jgi:Ran GTPase-activating protein 1
LDELESDDEDEDDDDDDEAKAGSEDEEGVEVEEKAARELIDVQDSEEQNVPQEKDLKVDDLADQLAKTEIK